MTYVHPYDLFAAIVHDCEAVSMRDGAATYPKVSSLLSTADEKFIYEACEQISDGLQARHPEWVR